MVAEFHESLGVQLLEKRTLVAGRYSRKQGLLGWSVFKSRIKDLIHNLDHNSLPMADGKSSMFVCPLIEIQKYLSTFEAVKTIKKQHLTFKQYRTY